MADLKKCVVHVGYPKCASTFLQLRVFNDFPHVESIGKPKKMGAFRDEISGRTRNIAGVANAATGSSRFLFQTVCADHAELLMRRLNAAGPDIVVWSDEDFVRPSRNIRKTPSLVDPVVVAENLKDLLDRLPVSDAPQILLVLRRQQDLLPAYYAQFGGDEVAHGFYAQGFENFLAFCEDQKKWGLGPVFDFARMVDLYRGLFGAENVHVLPMEGLFDPQTDAHRAKLARLLEAAPDALDGLPDGAAVRSKKRERDGVRVYMTPHRAYTARYRLWSFFDRALPKDAMQRYAGRPAGLTWRRFFKKIRPLEEFSVDAQTQARIRSAYAESNRRLDQTLDLGLGAYGYY